MFFACSLDDITYPLLPSELFTNIGVNEPESDTGEPTEVKGKLYASKDSTLFFLLKISFIISVLD